MSYKTLKIDLNARIVYVDDAKVDLTHKEYELLLYLINNANTAITREQLLEKVWGYGYYGDDRTLDTHMKSLRKKRTQKKQIIILTTQPLTIKLMMKKHLTMKRIIMKQLTIQRMIILHLIIKPLLKNKANNLHPMLVIPLLKILPE